jgi:hypothetical protein
MTINRAKTSRTKRLAGVIGAIAVTTLLSGAVGSGTAWADPGSAGDQAGNGTYAADPLIDPTYVKAMRTPDSGWTATTSDADLIKMGHESCQALDNGQNIVQIIGLLQTERPDASPHSDGYLIGVATVSYCPQHTKTIMDQARKLEAQSPTQSPA